VEGEGLDFEPRGREQGATLEEAAEQNRKWELGWSTPLLEFIAYERS